MVYPSRTVLSEVDEVITKNPAKTKKTSIIRSKPIVSIVFH